MTKFKKGDKVVKIGTREPIYIVMGETMKVGGPKEYVNPQIGIWTCYYLLSNGSRHIEEIPEDKLELVEASDSK